MDSTGRGDAVVVQSALPPFLEVQQEPPKEDKEGGWVFWRLRIRKLLKHKAVRREMQGGRSTGWWGNLAPAAWYFSGFWIGMPPKH